MSVLYPFVEPADVDDHILATLAAVFGSVAAFDCRFSRTQWFGQDVLWLDPKPAQSFRDLTAAVWSAFPHHPPYGGAHDDVVPHLTIAEGRLGSLSAVQRAEQAVQTGLPFSTHFERVLLIAGTQTPNSWGVLHEFRLGSARNGTW